MKKIFAFFSVLFLFLFSSPFMLSAQMSGEYTLGDTTCDFSTFYDAVSAVNSEGISGDIKFLVKPGDYGTTGVYNLTNPDNYTITFEYDGTENDSAVIHHLEVTESNHIVFSKFVMFPSEYQSSPCVEVLHSDSFKLSECTVYSVDGNNYDPALVTIKYYYEGPNYIANVEKCSILAKSKAVTTIAKGKITFNDNILKGEIKIGYQPWSHFINNTIYLTDEDFRAEEVRNNIFYPGTTNYIHVIANLLYNNIFYVAATLQSGHVTGNTFYGNISMAHLSGVKITDNKFYGNLKTVYCHGTKIRNNYLYGRCDLISDGTIFGNNFVFDTVRFTQGPGQLIYHNNFGYNAYLEMNYNSGRVINNNLSYTNILQPSVTVVKNNNYIHQNSSHNHYLGESPCFYNPGYLSDSVLYATNPALTGKGVKPLSHFKYDIDSVLRKNPPAIGANEICFQWESDTVTLTCDDSLCLDLCTDTLINQYWSPTNLFADSTAPRQVVHPDSALTVYLKNFDGTVSDSLYLDMNEVRPVAYAEYTINGLIVTFDNQSICAGRSEWHFGDGESSFEESPQHRYPSPGTYQCNLKVSNTVGSAYYSMYLILDNTAGNNAPAMDIHPNPAADIVKIQSPESITRLVLYNIEGKTVLELKPTNPHLIQTDISALQPGTYLLRITTPDKTYSRIIIKKEY